jgi:hypothetical protein
MPETFSADKDIFSVGKWNGDNYSEEDLQEMVANFERLSAENQNFRVPLKVDFFKDTKKNPHGGQPAVGWITKLSKVGQKLYAHIENIPRAVKDLIETKAYRQVSAEILWNMKYGEERLRRVLTGVALLGVEFPGVGNLEEFGKLYKYETQELEEFKQYITEEAETMTPEEIQKLQDEKNALEMAVEEGKKYALKLEEEKKEHEKKAAELANSQRQEQIKLFVDKMVKEGKVLPKHVGSVSMILENIDGQKLVKYAAADGAEKEESVLKMFEAFIEDMPKLVEFKEKAKDEKQEILNMTEKEEMQENLKTFSAIDESEGGDVESQKFDFLVKKYMEKNPKVSYREAGFEVSKIMGGK